ncbi:MAG: DUF4332 domain-containing protein [Hyphomicrobiaceae bacterium]|nr:DUF4332 domain-containing protein [Hyphomicrobiaceae bacterium]
MSLLFRIVYAAHANGTHHKLALDGLTDLARSDAEAWQRLFLKNVARLLEGSKAPDNQFKDFKNHVLHVGDNYWGGAPEQAQNWYGKLVAALRDANWDEAAWCAGVLSHYVTDPVHPFHTAQSEAENAIHRAVEWSINRGYDALRRDAAARARAETAVTPDGTGWLAELVCRGAEKANKHYGALIAHYNFNVGVVDPPAGLDARAREIVGDLILYASSSFARVLERAIDESGATAPDVSLTAETFLATLAMPRKWMEKRLANAEDRRAVEAMYDELMATGRVEKTLPEDDRVVRDLHAAEVLKPRQEKLASARSGRIAKAPAPPLPTQRTSMQATPERPVSLSALASAPPPLPPAMPYIPLPDSTTPAAIIPVQPPVPASDPPAPALSSVPPVPRALGERLARMAIAPLAATAENQADDEAGESSRHATGTSSRRRRITLDDDVEAAPAIGVRLSERLQRIGIRTVGDLLAADAGDTARQLDVRHISEATVALWQGATRLVMALPIVNGTQAQLLAGAGFPSVEAIAAADPVDLSAALLRYATTPAGQQLLRDGDVPDVERTKSWIDAAAAAVSAAA